jgi:hypothetical protein
MTRKVQSVAFILLLQSCSQRGIRETMEACGMQNQQLVTASTQSLHCVRTAINSLGNLMTAAPDWVLRATSKDVCARSDDSYESACTCFF